MNNKKLIYSLSSLVLILLLFGMVSNSLIKREPKIVSIENVSVGDVVGDFKVVKIERPIIYWSGKTIVTGHYSPPSDYDEVGFGPTFSVSDIDKARIPRIIGDSRSAWFCIGAEDQIHNELSSLATSTNITVEIEDYLLNLRESEACDLAKITKIVRNEFY